MINNVARAPACLRLDRLELRLRSSDCRSLVKHVPYKPVPVEWVTLDLVRWVDQPRQI